MGDPRAIAVSGVLDLDWDFWADIGPAMTCTEADRFAAMLRAYGQVDKADSLIEGHAQSDDEGDTQYREDPS